MSISAADVKKLRDLTGAGMMDCKKALTEAEGDFDKAIEILRKKGQKLSAKRADREAKEGVVIAKTSANKNSGIVLRLSCETDFVSKNDEFIQLAQNFANIALVKFPENHEALLALPFENGLSVQEKVTEALGVIGEKVELVNYERLEAPQIASYIHMGYKAGVLVGLNQNSQDSLGAGKDVAMQVAAMNPVALNEDSVDQSIIEKEIEIAKDQLRQEGKPEAMLDNIAQGKLKRFFKDNTLVNQAFIKDGKQTVAQYVKSVDSDLEITGFQRVALGQ